MVMLFSFLTERVIAMSFPSSGKHKMYRNPISVSPFSPRYYVVVYMVHEHVCLFVFLLLYFFLGG